MYFIDHSPEIRAHIDWSNLEHARDEISRLRTEALEGPVYMPSPDGLRLSPARGILRIGALPEKHADGSVNAAVYMHVDRTPPHAQPDKLETLVMTITPETFARLDRTNERIIGGDANRTYSIEFVCGAAAFSTPDGRPEFL
jgi:hypothetical protein